MVKHILSDDCEKLVGDDWMVGYTDKGNVVEIGGENARRIGIDYMGKEFDLSKLDAQLSGKAIIVELNHERVVPGYDVFYATGEFTKAVKYTGPVEKLDMRQHRKPTMLG